MTVLYLFSNATYKINSDCGSPCYASPEIYDNREYRGPEIDVWSLGVSLYGMVTGNLPFDGQNYYELKHQIKRAKLHFGDYLSEGRVLSIYYNESLFKY